MTQRKCLTCGRTEDQPVEYGCRDCIGWAGEGPVAEGHLVSRIQKPRGLVPEHVVAAMNASGATTESERLMVLRALTAYEKARSGG